MPFIFVKRVRLLLAVWLFASMSLAAVAQEINPSLFSEMRWRLVGPFRGGRSLSAVGVRGNPNLFYFGAVGGGVWKSDDAGTTWTPIFDSQPIASVGAIEVAASDPNIIYVGSGEADMRSDITYGNGVYKSSDGGHTWRHIGLEDSQQIGRILINPANPDIVFVAALGHAYGANSQRGVFRSTDGGKNWSRVLYKDDDTGASRSNFAGISERDWHPVEVGGESGTIAPDPKDDNTVFGGTVSPYDLRTTQNQNISPTLGRPGPFRHTWTLPLAFSLPNPGKFYFGHQVLFRSTNSGESWEVISPDLARENPGVPPNLDAITAKSGLASPRKGVIYSVAPGHKNANLIWVGTDDGLIHVTHDDGLHWQNVTPKQLTPWSKVGIIEASHFDQQSAYAAVDRHRLEDMRAYIYRTHDGGKSWQLAVKGIPQGAYVNVVREDWERRGLLYAGTELGMYVSFNDGEEWQLLQLNLPAVSVRDIAVWQGDLVIATHGRSFWVLDDISPLQQMEAQMAGEEAHLFKPREALRVRPGTDQGTPYPPEIPHGENPPDGAILDYYLKADAAAPVTLEILDSKGGLVRRYASDEKTPPVEEKSLDIPMYWIRPEKQLAAKAGMHRFVWDLHYAPLTRPAEKRPASLSRRRGQGPWALPGQYEVRLTVTGKSYSQPLLLKMDPRVKATEADLQQQFTAAQQAATALAQATRASLEADAISKQIKDAQAKASGNAALSAALEQFSRRVLAVAGEAPEPYGTAVMRLDTDQTSLRHLVTALTEAESAVESADAAPTAEQKAAIEQSSRTLQRTLADWQQFLTRGVPWMNSRLRQAGLAEVGH